MKTKINKLTLALKGCLIVILVALFIDLLPSFLSGYNQFSNQIGLESHKQTVFVKALSDSILQQHETFAVTGVKALQIQDVDKISLSGFAFGCILFFLCIYGLTLFIRIFKLSFKLINKIEKLQLLEFENISIIKKLGNTLVIFGGIDLVGGVGFKIYIDYKYHAIIGYKPSQPIDLDFNYIILGIVVLIVSSIIKETINLKQEQSLTI